MSEERFREVWRESRDAHSYSEGAPGVDRLQAQVFSSQLPGQIARIREDIRAGNYRFERLRFAPIPKDSGGHRIIAVPTVRDRLLQRVILRHLQDDSRFRASSPISFGFVKGRTLADAQVKAAALRSARPWMVQADIIKFFDRIPRDELKGLIQTRVRSTTIANLLFKAVDCEIEEVGGRGRDILLTSDIKRGLGLRQGMPISPMLSNLLLRSFDQALMKRGITALRYADDLAIFGTSQAECKDTLKYVVAELQKLKLEIPELEESGKTVISGPADTALFLGLEIRRAGSKYDLFPSMKKLTQVATDMSEIASIEACIKERRTLGQVARSLDSLIIGHKASLGVLKDRADPFLQRLGGLKKNALRNLLTELVGTSVVKSLNHDKLAVLGLSDFA